MVIMRKRGAFYCLVLIAGVLIYMNLEKVNDITNWGKRYIILHYSYCKYLKSRTVERVEAEL